MLTLTINATGVDYQELMSILDEAKKHLENEMTSASDVREDNSGEYNLEVTGSEEITSERFSDSMKDVDLEDVLDDIPTCFSNNTALYYCKSRDEFVIDNNDLPHFIAVDCELNINEESMKLIAYSRLFEELGYTGNFDHAEAVQEIEENNMDSLLRTQEEVYKEILSKQVLENADFEDFAKINPKEASDYAIEKDWL